MTASGHARFAPFVAALGRGPGRSRALSRAEAREAFAMALTGAADPHQVGAFLMLLRYRGEDADEIAGLVEAARDVCGLNGGLAADLDWPSYGAGRTRPAPWFLLAALALAAAGVRVLMHGSNEFSSGPGVADALRALGLAPAAAVADAAARLERDRFAYLPIAVLAPPLARLLGLRALFGLRSPVNTAARLLDPARAPAGVDGVFHPAYIDVHLAVAERLARPALLVLKGGGGEAEHDPAKPVTAHLWRAGAGRTELLLPAAPTRAPGAGSAVGAGGPATAGGPAAMLAEFAAIWRGEAFSPRAQATIEATIAMALLALGQADHPAVAAGRAARIWVDRFRADQRAGARHA
jgi:anthranilate phosphoribosyltransferase